MANVTATEGLPVAMVPIFAVPYLVWRNLYRIVVGQHDADNSCRYADVAAHEIGHIAVQLAMLSRRSTPAQGRFRI